MLGGLGVSCYTWHWFRMREAPAAEPGTWFLKYSWLPRITSSVTDK